MSLELLDKTRKINKLLTEQESDKIDFRQFCNVLSNELNVNVLLTSKKGKVLGLKECQGTRNFRNKRYRIWRLYRQCHKRQIYEYLIHKGKCKSVDYWVRMR